MSDMDFPINASWRNLACMSQYEHCLPIQVCRIICSGKAVELSGRATIQYSVYVFALRMSYLMSYSVRAYLLGALAL